MQQKVFTRRLTSSSEWKRKKKKNNKLNPNRKLAVIKYLSYIKKDTKYIPLSGLSQQLISGREEHNS